MTTCVFLVMRVLLVATRGVCALPSAAALAFLCRSTTPVAATHTGTGTITPLTFTIGSTTVAVGFTAVAITSSSTF